MIYLIAGKARSGKETLGKFLEEELEKRGRKACRIQLMRTIKGYCKDYFGWDGEDDTKPREFLQKLGTEIIRDKMNLPLFHIERLLGDILVLSNFYDDFIVSDVRLPIELEEIKKKYSSTAIRIIRDDTTRINELSEAERSHITERALDNYFEFDYEVTNTTLEDLRKQAEKIVREVENNEKND